MFLGCEALSSLTLPDSFDTSKVKDMSDMFDSCNSLSSLTLPAEFDTSSAEDFWAMFYNCSKLTSITQETPFDTSSAKNLGYMFYGCDSLGSLSLPESFDTSALVENRYTFDDFLGSKNTTSLTSLELPAAFFNTGYATADTFGSLAPLTQVTIHAASSMNAASQLPALKGSNIVCYETETGRVIGNESN